MAFKLPFGNKKTAWDKLNSMAPENTTKYRDVFEDQQLERSELAEPQTMTSRLVLLGIGTALAMILTWIALSLFQFVPAVIFGTLPDIDIETGKIVLVDSGSSGPAETADPGGSAAGSFYEYEGQTIYVGEDGMPSTEDDWYYVDVDGDGVFEKMFIGVDRVPFTDDDVMDGEPSGSGGGNLGSHGGQGGSGGGSNGLQDITEANLNAVRQMDYNTYRDTYFTYVRSVGAAFSIYRHNINGKEYKASDIYSMWNEINKGNLSGYNSMLDRYGTVVDESSGDASGGAGSDGTAPGGELDGGMAGDGAGDGVADGSGIIGGASGGQPGEAGDGSVADDGAQGDAGDGSGDDVANGEGQDDDEVPDDGSDGGSSGGILDESSKAPSVTVTKKTRKATLKDYLLSFNLWKIFVTLLVGLAVFGIGYPILKKNLEAQNAGTDVVDLNQYKDDQHVQVPQELQRNYDWFPDVGAHSPLQVSSMLSHMMLESKGLKTLQVMRRYEKDVKDKEGNIEHYKGEPVLGSDGQPVFDTEPFFDDKFIAGLFDASGMKEKKFQKKYDVRDIPYNPGDENRDKLKGADTVADMINKYWTFPEYEPQRPAGAYIVDTQPVNTMVLAIVVVCHVKNA